MVAGIEDDIEETRLEAEEALARGSHWEHKWHLDRIAWMTEHLASLRARQPRPEPLAVPALPPPERDGA